MVPTLTRFGRVSECTLLDSNVGAAVEVTRSLLPDPNRKMCAGCG